MRIPLSPQTFPCFALGIALSLVSVEGGAHGHVSCLHVAESNCGKAGGQRRPDRLDSVLIRDDVRRLHATGVYSKAFRHQRARD